MKLITFCYRNGKKLINNKEIFFRKWIGLKLYLESNGSMLGEDILASMKKRGKQLFDNYMVLAIVGHS